MHYYQFNIADYRKDASHLTPVEHHIYRWLIDEYFLQESPIPNNVPLLLRKMQLKNKHRESVEQILFEFFYPACDEDYKPVDLQIHTEYVQLGEYPETCQYWVHQRIESNIEDYKGLIEKKSAAGKASAASRAIKKNTSSTHVKQGLSDVQQTINHKPLTINQEPVNVLPNGNTRENEVSTGNGQVPIKQIVDKWNVLAKSEGLPQAVKVTTTIKGQIRQRWKDIPSLDRWDNFFEAIRINDFLSGRASPGIGRSKPFRATLLWITKETNFAKIAAGEYD